MLTRINEVVLPEPIKNAEVTNDFSEDLDLIDASRVLFPCEFNKVF